MISLEDPRGPADWLKLYRLYVAAFPASERKPFSVICKMWRAGKTQVFCIRQNGMFAGMLTTIQSPDLILLDYFAVAENMRGKGVGTAALREFLSQNPDTGIFLEIESTKEAGPGGESREKRKQFYENCGLKSLNVYAEVFGVPMELLGRGCKLDFDGYYAFYRDQYSPWAAKHIRRM